jgi:hypothetical protein
MKRELYKVQKSVVTSDSKRDTPRILVYNKDKSSLFEGDATEDLLMLMSGIWKAFVWGHMNKKKVIVLDMGGGRQEDPGW